MPYIQGFLLAVPAAKKEAYLKLATDMSPLFKEFGASRIVEAWEEEVPDGQVTDMRHAVKAEKDEVIVFSWHEYPSKEVAQAAYGKMMSDPSMEACSKNMPFDGKRMIYGGFMSILDV